MAELAFLLKGTATIRMEGTARVVDADGETVRVVNLADLGEVTVPLESANGFWPKDLCGIKFEIDNVFVDELIAKGTAD